MEACNGTLLVSTPSLPITCYLVEFVEEGWVCSLCPFFWSGLYRLMRKYKDWENEKLGTRRARFLAVRKQDKGAEASFGTRGGRGLQL